MIKETKYLIIRSCENGIMRTSIYQKLRFLFTNQISFQQIEFKGVKYIEIKK